MVTILALHVNSHTTLNTCCIVSLFNPIELLAFWRAVNQVKYILRVNRPWKLIGRLQTILKYIHFAVQNSLKAGSPSQKTKITVDYSESESTHWLVIVYKFDKYLIRAWKLDRPHNYAWKYAKDLPKELPLYFRDSTSTA